MRATDMAIQAMVRAAIAFIVIAGLTADVWGAEGTGFYLTGGLTAHNLNNDCPEYCGANPLGNFGAGFTLAPAKGVYIDLHVNHESSVPDVERGYGQNKAGLQLRWYP